jgi:uncharacterized damage-inducible protein DinB
MDEYARAATAFCLAVERFDQDSFGEERPSDDPDTLSVRTVCLHVCGAARGYANHLRNAQGASMQSPETLLEERIRTPADVRTVLAEQLRFTEESVEPLRNLADDDVMSMEFRVRWGPLYNPESMLEHAICHLLRHRRQLELW